MLDPCQTNILLKERWCSGVEIILASKGGVILVIWYIHGVGRYFSVFLIHDQG